MPDAQRGALGPAAVVRPGRMCGRPAAHTGRRNRVGAGLIGSMLVSGCARIPRRMSGGYMWGASIRAVDVTGDIYNLYGWILHIFAVPSQWASEITNTLLPETPSPATPHSRHDDKVVLVMLICHQGFAGGFCRGRCKQPRSPGSSAQSRSKRSKIFLRRVSGLVGTYIDTRAVNHRAEVRRSFIPTTVRDESQVTPQGRHRWGSNRKPTASSSMPLPTYTID